MAYGLNYYILIGNPRTKQFVVTTHKTETVNRKKGLKFVFRRTVGWPGTCNKFASLAVLVPEGIWVHTITPRPNELSLKGFGRSLLLRAVIWTLIEGRSNASDTLLQGRQAIVIEPVKSTFIDLQLYGIVVFSKLFLRCYTTLSKKISGYKKTVSV